MKCWTEGTRRTAMTRYRKNAGSVCLHKGLWILAERTAGCTSCCKTHRAISSARTKVSRSWRAGSASSMSLLISWETHIPDRHVSGIGDAWIPQSGRSISHRQHEHQYIIRHHWIYFCIYKSKKSPNKLYGVTSLFWRYRYIQKFRTNPLQTINFKERIVNVKLKDISTWSTEHLSKNWVTERTKTLRKVS